MLTRLEANDLYNALQEIMYKRGFTGNEMMGVIGRFTESPIKIEKVCGAFNLHDLATKLNEVIHALNKLNGDNNNDN